jgi:hypothetical protein
VVEVLARQPRTALEHDHLGAARGEVVGGDGAAEAAADDEDIGAFHAHSGLPDAVVLGWRLASSRP